MTPRKPKRAKALGVTDAEYERLLAAQDGHCALCLNVPKTKHDARRSWSCRYCKTANPGDAEHCQYCERLRPKPSRFHVDHDHATGRVRGLLCYRCNRALPNYVTERWLLHASAYLAGPHSYIAEIDRRYGT